MMQKTKLRFSEHNLAVTLITLVLIAGGIVWGLMILHRHYDYDEVLRAHSIWMTSQGLRPYHDFFEAHPPYFALLAPLARNLTDPSPLLITLRLIATTGNLLFLAGLATLAARTGGQGWLVAILGTALTAFCPAVLEFLTEFRIDGWGYSLAVWSIIGFLHSTRTWRYIGLGAGTGIATLLFCPKLALLPPMILVFEQIKARASLRNALWAFGSYALGIGIAGGLFWLWLLANGIEVNMVFACLVKFNGLSNATSGDGRGLLREITRQWTLTVPFIAAFAVWTIQCFRARSFPAIYPAALALWLFAQAALVSYPYKQYYGPWFLFASGFFPFLYAVFQAFPKYITSAVFFGLCALSITVSGLAAFSWANLHESEAEENVIRLMNGITEPGDRVVGLLPLHPIYRRDTFYDFFNTYDPAGHHTADILDGIPQLHDLVSEKHYHEELEAHPPAIIVLLNFAPPRQLAVLSQFIKERGYGGLKIGGVPVAVRPDLLQKIRSNPTYRAGTSD